MNNDKVIDMALTEIPEFLVQRGFAWVCLPTVKVFRDQDTGQLYVEEYTDEAELAEIEEAAALKSLENMNLPENVRIETLIVDNDIEKSAQKVFNELKNSFNFN